MKKQIRRIILLPLKMIKTLSDCKGMQLFVGCVIHVRKSFLCYYHFFTFQLDSFPESDICYSVKKEPLPQFIRQFYQIYLCSGVLSYNLFIQFEQNIRFICSLRSFRNLVSGKRHLQDRHRCQPERISQELLQRLQIRRTGYGYLLL